MFYRERINYIIFIAEGAILSMEFFTISNIVLRFGLVSIKAIQFCQASFRVFSVFAAAWGTPSGLALLGFLDFVSLSG